MASSSARDLERARTRLAELTGEGRPPIVVADELGLIIHVDRELATPLGWSPEELIGQTLTRIIPKRFRDAHHIGFSRFLMTGRPTLLERPLQLWVATRGGEEILAEHTITALRAGGAWLFAAAIRVEVGRGG